MGDLYLSDLIVRDREIALPSDVAKIGLGAAVADGEAVLVGGHAKNLGSSPALSGPRFNRLRPSLLLLVRAGKLRLQQHAVLPAGLVDRLPCAFQLWRQVCNRLARIDHDGEQLLVERARERVFAQAPARGEQVRRNEEDHRLAAVRLLVQRPLSPLARGDAALGVEIEEDVVPGLAREPVAQGDGLEIVSGRVAEEDAGHRGRLARAGASKSRRSSPVKRGQGHFRHSHVYEWPGGLSQVGRRNCAISSLRSR